MKSYRERRLINRHYLLFVFHSFAHEVQGRTDVKEAIKYRKDQATTML